MREFFAICSMLGGSYVLIRFGAWVLSNLPAAGLRYRVDETGAVIFPPFEEEAAVDHEKIGGGISAQRADRRDTHTQTGSVRTIGTGR